AFAFVERNLVQVVLNLRLVRVIRILRLGDSSRVRIARHRPAEDQVLSIRGPKRARVHKFRIVRAWQWPHPSLFTVIRGQNAACRIEDLTELDALVVGAVKPVENARRESRLLALMFVRVVWRPDRRNHEASIRRHLRHESKTFHRGIALRGLVVQLKRTSMDHILTLNGHFGRHRHESVEPFVVPRSIEIEPKRLSITRKGMTICAGRQVCHYQMALRLSNVSYLPLDEWNRRSRQWRNRPFFIRRWKH